MQRKAVNAFFGEKLDLVKTHIDRISHIVREVSSFARPANPERHYVQINDVVEASINLTRYDKRVKKDIQLATVLDPATPKTVVIEDQLLQVFMNLILNAADAMESGGKLTVTTRCRDDAIEICFSDTGIGIPSDVRPHIFDPFFTTKSVGKGMGLGLSVSHSMIKNMGGEIDVESHSGEGTTFTITLPVIASISEKETNDVWENLDRR
jgi:signal transduction histidine kinase